MLWKTLIVEDDPVSLHLLRTMLEKWGYRVIAAVNGSDAWAKFQADEDIQMVISDWMMPDLDGVELCKLIKSCSTRPYTFFMLLTAKSQIEDIVEGMESGADDFITKPYNQYELRVRIRAGERVLSLHNQLSEKVRELSMASEQMLRDLEAAAAIQVSMLPSRKKMFPGIKYSWNYKPSDRIGGDFFNIFDLDENHIGVYIFDVSGHGVPAALQSVALGRMLSTFAADSSILHKSDFHGSNNGIVSPREVTNQLNHSFQTSTTRGDFITLLYGVIDVSNKTFTFSRAGHPAPIIVSSDKAVSIIDEGGIPIGILPQSDYKDFTAKLSSGDRIFLFTDGFTEVANRKADRLGEERLRNIVKESYSFDLNEAINYIIEQVNEWQDGMSPEDDMTILGIEFNS